MGIICEMFFADEDAGYNTGFYKLGDSKFSAMQCINKSPAAWKAYRETHPDWEYYYTLNEDGTMSSKDE